MTRSSYLQLQLNRSFYKVLTMSLLINTDVFLWCKSNLDNVLATNWKLNNYVIYSNNNAYTIFYIYIMWYFLLLNVPLIFFLNYKYKNWWTVSINNTAYNYWYLSISINIFFFKKSIIKKLIFLCKYQFFSK